MIMPRASTRPKPAPRVGKRRSARVRGSTTGAAGSSHQAGFPHNGCHSSGASVPVGSSDDAGGGGGGESPPAKKRREGKGGDGNDGDNSSKKVTDVLDGGPWEYLVLFVVLVQLRVADDGCCWEKPPQAGTDRLTDCTRRV